MLIQSDASHSPNPKIARFATPDFARELSKIAATTKSLAIDVIKIRDKIMGDFRLNLFGNVVAAPENPNYRVLFPVSVSAIQRILILPILRKGLV